MTLNATVSSRRPAAVFHTGIGCGVEAMSRVFLGQALTPETGSPAPDGWELDMPDQFTAAERIAKKRGVTREDADRSGWRRRPRRTRRGRTTGSPGRSSPSRRPS